MASLYLTSSLKDYQQFVSDVYGFSNSRHFTVYEMLTNVERFIMRCLKGIRKSDTKKIKINLLISLSWFLSTMNQLKIDLEDSVWKRFPYACSYCGACPCMCKEKKIQKRLKFRKGLHSRPKTIQGLQKMFNDIYPAPQRTLESAGVHLAEEIGELSEAVLKFRGSHTDKDLENVVAEASDLFSCLMGVCNSIHFNVAKEFARSYTNGCHVCHKTPCVCTYQFIMDFRS